MPDSNPTPHLSLILRLAAAGIDDSLPVDVRLFALEQVRLYVVAVSAEV